MMGGMMTVHKLSAGDGYLYYMQEVASGDELRSRSQELKDYYLEKGNPPGRWIGAGRSRLGLDGEVKERQMQLLYGMGMHPDTDEIMERVIAEGGTKDDALAQARLGRAYAQYNLDDDPFVVALNDALSEAKNMKGGDLDPEERRAIRFRTAAKFFAQEKLRSPADREELGKYLAAKLKGHSTAVAGYDLSFSPQKSVSTLWALADERTAKIIEKAHDDAIATAVAFLEKEAIRTRAGVGGIKQIDVDGGVIAAKFRHYDSRTGDPQLHDHVVVSNKVLGSDGLWRAIDGRLVYKSAVAASELYNQQIAANLAERLGVRFEARDMGEGKRHVLEVAGIDRTVMEAFSSRRTGIKERVEQLVAEYRETHGTEPSSKLLTKFAQQATLETRPQKKTGQTLRDLRNRWQEVARQRLGDEGLARMLAVAMSGNAPGAALDDLDRDSVAVSVVSKVSEGRSIWSRRHIEAEARRQVSTFLDGHGVDESVITEITERALNQHSVKITDLDPELTPDLDILRRRDGTSVYVQHQSDLYTSTGLLDAEAEILDAAQTDVIPPISAETFDRIVAESQAQRKAEGRAPLAPTQVAMAREFATGSRIVTAGVGPAGAGKTTSMRLFADAIRAGGGRVFGLAPSRQAAAVLAGDIGIDTTTIHAFLVSDAPLSPGDVILIDEAGMAGTRNILDVLRRAKAAGAHVRLVGDYRQLAAIESGGALRLVHEIAGGPELEDVFRFDSHEERAASLVLRHGNPEREDVFGWYVRHDRIVGATAEHAATAAYAAWQSDVIDGLNAIMIAPDTETVASLNERAQAFRIASGDVDLTVTSRSRDGHTIGIGDVVVARKNDSRLLVGGADARFVVNGSRWVVQAIGGDGSLHVRALEGPGTAVLPAAYVSQNVQLGYALTVHRAQGVTVDACHTVLTADVSRNAAYVAMTRGRKNNAAYVVTEDGAPVSDTLDQIAHRTEGSGSAHESIREVLTDRRDPIRASLVYRDLCAQADRRRMIAHLREATKELAGTDLVEKFLGTETWPKVVGELVAAEAEGFSPAHMLRRCLPGLLTKDVPSEKATTLLHWRITKTREDAPALAASDRPRSFQAVSTSDLEKKLASAAAREDTTRRDLEQIESRYTAEHPRSVDLTTGETAPAWPDRPFGAMTYEALKDEVDRLALQRDEAALLGEEDRRAGEAWQHARAELTTRHHMAWPDRAREDWQRDRAVAPDLPATAEVTGYDVDQARERYRGAAELREAIQDELRYRSRLPDGPAAPVLPEKSLPMWIAPTAALHDPLTPPQWRDALAGVRSAVVERVRGYQVRLEVNRPAWAEGLSRSDALALALWRAEHQIPESEIDRMPVDDPDALSAEHRELYERATAAGPVEDIAPADALARLRDLHSPARPSNEEMLRRVAELRRKAEQHRDMDSPERAGPDYDHSHNIPDPDHGRHL